MGKIKSISKRFVMYNLRNASYGNSISYLFVAAAFSFAGYHTKGPMQYVGLIWFLLTLVNIERAITRSILEEKDEEINSLRHRLEAKNVSDVPEGLWKCGCGTLNSYDSTNCSKCGRNIGLQIR